MIDITPYIETAQAWLLAHILTFDNLLQLALIVAASGLGYIVARPLRRWADMHRPKMRRGWRFTAVNAGYAILLPLSIWLFLNLSLAAATQFVMAYKLVQIFTNLVGVWVGIRFLTLLLRKGPMSRLLALMIWVIAALNILGVSDKVLAMLDAVGVTMGDVRLSLLLVAKAILAFVVVWWVSQLISRFLEGHIDGLHDVPASQRVLLRKILRFSIISLALLVGLNAIGIDLTALAVFGGAIGLGLGFGLQKIVSNFISGIILLMDNSIKPGDVIAVEDTYGWVNRLGMRHVSVITRDGKEHLIPNELLITEKVENWSYSDNNVRLHMPVGVSYNADIRKARQLMIDAGNAHARTLDVPKAVCNIKGFGDSSVDLELRIWIDDPSNGIGNIKSDIFQNIWDAFHEHGIEIPFPQRDVHIKQLPEAIAKEMGAKTPVRGKK